MTPGTPICTDLGFIFTLFVYFSLKLRNTSLSSIKLRCWSGCSILQVARVHVCLVVDVGGRDEPVHLVTGVQGEPLLIGHRVRQPQVSGYLSLAHKDELLKVIGRGDCLPYNLWREYSWWQAPTSSGTSRMSCMSS